MIFTVFHNMAYTASVVYDVVREANVRYVFRTLGTYIEKPQY